MSVSGASAVAPLFRVGATYPDDIDAVRDPVEAAMELLSVYRPQHWQHRLLAMAPRNVLLLHRS